MTILLIIIIIIIIIMMMMMMMMMISILYEDNVFCMNASLPYCTRVNIDIGYYRTCDVNGDLFWEIRNQFMPYNAEYQVG